MPDEQSWTPAHTSVVEVILSIADVVYTVGQLWPHGLPAVLAYAAQHTTSDRRPNVQTFQRLAHQGIACELGLVDTACPTLRGLLGIVCDPRRFPEPVLAAQFRTADGKSLHMVFCFEVAPADRAAAIELVAQTIAQARPEHWVTTAADEEG